LLWGLSSDYHFHSSTKALAYSHKTTMANILVVDDEHGIRDLLFEILNDEGHQVELAENAAQARSARAKACPDLVLLDIWMPDTDGVSLLKEWAGNGLLTMPVVMMSGHATIETAVQATKLGAHSFLEKPITLQKLLQAIDLGLKKGASLHSTQSLVAQTTSFAQDRREGALSVDASIEPGLLASHLVPMHHLPPSSCVINLNQPLREAKELFDIAYFNYHLHMEHGSVAKVAEKTGLERTHLYRKLKQLGIDTSRSKV
jgi:DNA-binding NtrC family response regulator